MIMLSWWLYLVFKIPLLKFNFNFQLYQEGRTHFHHIYKLVKIRPTFSNLSIAATSFAHWFVQTVSYGSWAILKVLTPWRILCSPAFSNLCILFTDYTNLNYLFVPYTYSILLWCTFSPQLAISRPGYWTLILLWHRPTCLDVMDYLKCLVIW